MPRRARESIKSQYIHVITQGIKKEYIFKNEYYKKEYLKLIKKFNKEYENIHILAYCIMDNHAHFLIHIVDTNELSQFMKKVNVSFGIYYNQHEDRVGFVFRNRYFTQEILDRPQLYNTLAYIHFNPVKAQMVKKPEDYKFSSYHLFKENKIEKQIINLIFESDNYSEFFYYLHRDFKSEGIKDIKENVDEKYIKKIIIEFCNENDITTKELRKNNFILKKIVDMLKKEYDISNKDIIELIGIGKNRIYNMYKKNKI